MLARWPEAPPALLTGTAGALAGLPIDHDVAPVPARGGAEAGHARLKAFVGRDLATYADDRHDPDDPRTSGLSPYLHFGHVSAHEVFDAVMTHEGWTRRKLAASGGGKREGWWGVSRGAEAFLDQLVTWREIGFNAAAHLAGYDRYDTLPAWARATLAAHARDPRPHRYDRDAFERAATHDPLWNAAQTELVRDGRIHTYLRMLWGKKILEWSRTPQDALDTMIHLNDKYALDGRDPNSVQRHLLVPGPLRSAVGAGARDLRHGALHEQREHRAQAAGQGLSGPLRSVGAVLKSACGAGAARIVWSASVTHAPDRDTSLRATACASISTPSTPSRRWPRPRRTRSRNSCSR